MTEAAVKTQLTSCSRAFAEEHKRPVLDVERDGVTFCTDLLHRGLIELDGDG